MPSQMYDGNYNFPYNERDIELPGYQPIRQEPNISISAVISASCSVIVNEANHYLPNDGVQISQQHYQGNDVVVNCREGQQHDFYNQNTDPRLQMCNYNNDVQYGTSENNLYVNSYPGPCSDQYFNSDSQLDNSNQTDFGDSSIPEEYVNPEIPPDAASVQPPVEINVDEMLSNGVTVAGYKPRRMIQKRKKTKTPNESRNHCYWDKRRKNNDSARRSREAKKEKERNFYKRALELEYENFQLKEKVAYLEEQLMAFNRLNNNAEPC